MNALSPIPETTDLPVVVIGAGPVGLAAAAHLLARGLPVKLLEAGDYVAAHVHEWGHIRLFSPWSYNIDKAARALLEKHGWQAPKRSAHPTGAELYAQYLKPLAETPEIAAVLETNARVVAVSRADFDKMKSAGRETAPFSLVIRKPDGSERRELARAVIDTSGTWSHPNPIGADGLPIPGEREAGFRLAYGAPDVLGAALDDYANRRVLVIGAGHSAANVLLDLARLRDRAPDTSIVWAVRSASLAKLFGGGANDRLEARGALGHALEALVKSGGLELHRNSRVAALDVGAHGIKVQLQQPSGQTETVEVDRVIAATGQRPELSMLREIRLDLDPATESPRVLAPLIDPNVHSCGTVRPHGHRELAQPDTGFYIAGIKSYGRAPTFLMATGYEQVRSIAAALAGDMAAADDVQLDLPETGVCSSNLKDGESCAAPEAERAAGSCCAPVCCEESPSEPVITTCCDKAAKTAAAALPKMPKPPVAAGSCC